ncbi:MAG: hypothetical protein R2712_06590 [Vicinamibacterales bacterium]
MELAINGAIVDRARAETAHRGRAGRTGCRGRARSACWPTRSGAGASARRSPYTRVASSPTARRTGCLRLEQDDVEARLLRPGATLDETVAAVALVRRAVGNRSRVTGSRWRMWPRVAGALRSVLDALRAGLDALSSGW